MKIQLTRLKSISLLIMTTMHKSYGKKTADIEPIRAKSLPPFRKESSSSNQRKKNKRHRKPKTNKSKELISRNGNQTNITKFSRAFSALTIDKQKNEKTPSKSTPSRKFSTTSSKRSDDKGRDLKKKLNLKDIAQFILSKKVKNIVVMAGAGISTGSGIPDFRTPGTGLYDNLKKYKIPHPTSIFDLEYFHNNPKPFFELAKELYPNTKYQPGHAHHFVRLLHEKGLLLRMYTQNIDGLERVSGIPPEKLVEAHGTFSTATCTRCYKKHNGKEIKSKVLRGIIPRCQETELCWGVVKPDIVFFGEDLPKRFYYYLKDFPMCDLLLIMGTSLEVEPFASLTESVRGGIPRVLFNREVVGPFKKKNKIYQDLAIAGDMKDSIHRFVDYLHWEESFEEIIDDHNKNKAFIESEADLSGDSGFSSSSSARSSSKIKPLANLFPSHESKRSFYTRHTPAPNASLPKTNSSQNISYYDYIRKKTKENSNSPPPFTIEVRSFGEVPLIHYTEKYRNGKCNTPSSSSDETTDTSDSDSSSTE